MAILKNSKTHYIILIILFVIVIALWTIVVTGGYTYSESLKCAESMLGVKLRGKITLKDKIEGWRAFTRYDGAEVKIYTIKDKYLNQIITAATKHDFVRFNTTTGEGETHYWQMESYIRQSTGYYQYLEIIDYGSDPKSGSRETVLIDSTHSLLIYMLEAGWM